MLGRGENYTVQVIDRGSFTVIADITRYVTRMQWTRITDDTSSAKVELAISECCQVIAKINSIRHEIMIKRDDKIVWNGIIVTLVQQPYLDLASLECRDVTALLDWRVVHNDIDNTGAPTDLATIANNIIVDALSPDDWNILPYVTVTPAGVTGERKVQASENRTAGEEIRELARTGIDFTTIGRRILIRGEELNLIPIGVLHESHIIGDIQVIEAGLEMASKWYVQGSALTGIAGGVDSYFGLVERVARETSILDQNSANQAAQTRLDLKNRPPAVLQIPDGSQLSPKSPFDINQLIPGCHVDVSLKNICKPIYQTMRLQKVVVDIDAGNEKVAVNLQPLGTKST